MIDRVVARWRGRIGGILVASLLASIAAAAQSMRGVDPGKTLTEFKGHRWAVVVGISRYQDPAIQALEYADRDARAMYDFLVSPRAGLLGFEPDHVQLLLNEQATIHEIRTALQTFLRRSTENDVVVVYFAGHGAPEPDPVHPRDQALSELYLYAHDTRTDNVRATAYEMDDVQRDVGRAHARGLMLFVDACHSAGIGGQTRRRGDGAENQINRAFLEHLESAAPSKVSFTASEATQVSREDRRWGGGHGVFTYFLLQALAGEADANKDGVVTLGETIEFVRDRVMRATENKQTPTTSSTAYDRDWPVAVVLSPAALAAMPHTPMIQAIDSVTTASAARRGTQPGADRTSASTPTDLATAAEADPTAMVTAPRAKVDAAAASARARSAGAASSGASDRRQILGMAPWMTCGGGEIVTCTLPWLYPDVVRVRYGESEASLDHTLDLAEVERMGSVREAPVGHSRWIDNVVVRPGATAVYVQLEFKDGARSDTRRVNVGRPMRATRSVPIHARESATAPVLFAVYVAGDTGIQFVPDVPPGVAKLEFTFDAGGFLAVPQTEGQGVARTFAGSVADSAVRVRMHTHSGAVIGPYTYVLHAAASIPSAAWKDAILRDVPAVVQCTRIVATLPSKPAPDSAAAKDPNYRPSMDWAFEYDKRMNYIESALELAGLTFVKEHLPAVACRTRDWQHPAYATASDVQFAAVVREIWIGTQPGKLARVARFESPDMSRALDQSSLASAPLWHAVLPAATSGVYVQLVFRDGTRTEEVRVSIDVSPVR